MKRIAMILVLVLSSAALAQTTSQRWAQTLVEEAGQVAEVVSCYEVQPAIRDFGCIVVLASAKVAEILWDDIARVWGWSTPFGSWSETPDRTARMTTYRTPDGLLMVMVRPVSFEGSFTMVIHEAELQ